MPVLADLSAALRARDLTRFLALLRAHFAQDHNYLWGAGYAQLLFGHAPHFPAFRDDPAQSPAAQCRERLCRDHLARLLAGNRNTSPAHHIIGPEFDTMGDRFEPSSWGIAMVLNFVALHHIKPTRRVCAVVTMRDDGITALEWIAHYRVLGFEHIFVFSNDNRDGSGALLAALADQKIITYVEQQTALIVSPQMRAFDYSLHFMPVLRDFEWVIYLDSDEFLLLDRQDNDSIHNFLNRAEAAPAGRADAILFPWRWYVSAGRRNWAPDILLRRFQHARVSNYKKALVRLASVVSMRQVHFPETETPPLMLDADLAPARAETALWPELRPAHAMLNHYWCKSFPEFMVKQQRGMTITGETRRAYHRDESLFFTWNGPETVSNHVAPPPELIALVEAELARLRTLPGIGMLEESCLSLFHAITASAGGDYERIKRDAEAK